MKGFSKLLYESKNYSDDDNNLLHSLNEDEDEFDTHEDDSLDNMEATSAGSDDDTGDMTTPDDTATDASTSTDSTTTDTTDGGSSEGNDNGDSSTDSSTDVTSQPITPDDSGKKLQLYNSFKSIYDINNNLIDRVSNFREVLESDKASDKNVETIEFIEEKLLSLRDNIKLILTDKIKSFEYEKTKTLFVYIKSEINLLVNLFSKISKTDNKQFNS